MPADQVDVRRSVAIPDVLYVQDALWSHEGEGGRWVRFVIVVMFVTVQDGRSPGSGQVSLACKRAICVGHG